MTAAGGPVYYRLSSSTQTEEDVKKQIESGETLGKAPRWSTIPKVKAYAGHLPKGGTGIEFTTDVSPDPDGIPTQPTWSGPREASESKASMQDPSDDHPRGAEFR
jgi:hypothetical protein